MCSFNLAKQHWKFHMGMNSVFMLDLSDNIYAGVGTDQKEFLNCFHLHQLPNFFYFWLYFLISMHISLRLRKVLESRIANCPSLVFGQLYFLIISDQTKANLAQDFQFLKVGHRELAGPNLATWNISWTIWWQLGEAKSLRRRKDSEPGRNKIEPKENRFTGAWAGLGGRETFLGSMR